MTFDKQALSAALIQLQQETEAVLAKLERGRAPVELDQNRVGRLSRMDAMQGQAMAQASVQRHQHVLVRVKTALERLQQDDFGRCDHCDNPIAQARLIANPLVEYCIDCAQRLERQAR